MLLTPTFVGLLLAGAAFWALVWAAIHKLDEIPYLKEFTSTQEVLDWIERHKGLTLVITEGVNFLLHASSRPRNSGNRSLRNWDKLRPIMVPSGPNLKHLRH